MYRTIFKNCLNNVADTKSDTFCIHTFYIIISEPGTGQPMENRLIASGAQVSLISHFFFLQHENLATAQNTCNSNNLVLFC